MGEARTYAKQAQFIKILSSDGHEFLLSRKAAEQSGTIRSMLSSGKFMESGKGRIVFKEIEGKILEKVIQYFYYKTKHANSTTPPEFKIEPNLALDLLIAANYLDV